MEVFYIICVIQILVNILIRYFVKEGRIRKLLLLGFFLLLLLVSILPIIKVVNFLIESGAPDAVSFSGSSFIFFLPIVILVIHYFIHLVCRVDATND
ncbi:hypothetical protein [Sporocytophaga myxococcoides]|uniref:hypothetical protein n=1 Tax=Sporocytophaga myxococcoides TaxID=153721 RepID=UPI00048CAEA1|nr:hypothetical protein [Sporocytophaga myxococcoides]